MTTPRKATLLVLFSVIILGVGCYSQTPPTTPAPNPSVTPPKPLPWEETYGRFYTKDLTRAQEEIPFPIILPSYVPDKRKDAPPPDIIGPLTEFRDDNDIGVDIKYLLYLGDEILGQIIIKQSNRHISLGDPQLNPELEKIEIDGKWVIKTKDSFAPNESWFSFNLENVYFLVYFQGLPTEEAIKIVESMIKQIE